MGISIQGETVQTTNTLHHTAITRARSHPISSGNQFTLHAALEATNFNLHSANGFFCQDQLGKLSKTENYINGFTIPSMHLITARDRRNIILRSYLFHSAVDPSPAMLQLPWVVVSERVIQVAIVGHVTTQQKDKVKKFYQARGDCIKDALFWLVCGIKADPETCMAKPSLVTKKANRCFCEITWEMSKVSIHSCFSTLLNPR